MELWTVQKLLAWTAAKFKERGKEPARLEAEVLLCHTLSMNRVGLYTHFDRPLDTEELAKFRDLVKRRLAGEPSAYLVGRQEFWGISLKVGPGVLIPRRDTETVIEVILDEVAPQHHKSSEDESLARTLFEKNVRVLDVCTGSGAIAIALATALKKRRSALLVATDNSSKALEIARENVEENGFLDTISLIETDLASGVDGPFDVVVSNPPYVRSSEIATLSSEVRSEPSGALDGGADGLAVYRRLTPMARDLLVPNGLLVFEIGFDQAVAVSSLCQQAGLVSIRTVKDLAGCDRVVVARRDGTTAIES